MVVGTVQLLGVGWEIAECKMVIPGTKESEAIDGVLLTFVCQTTGMRVEIPMPQEFAHKLAADLDGRQVIIARPGAGPSGKLRI